MRRHALAVAAIGALAALLYANTLDVPFLFDDESNIVEHPATHAERIDRESMRRAVFESRSRSRPVAYVSFAVQHALHGLDVAGYHVVNISIHAVNGALVYALALLLLGRLRRLDRQRLTPRQRDLPWVALAAALLFVAHPVHTQAVTYVVQRMTSLSTCFYLSSLLLVFVGRYSAGRRRVAALAGAALLFGLALGSKQISAVLPLAVLLVEWLFYRDASVSFLKRNGLMLGASASVLLGLALVFLGGSFGEGILAPYEQREFTLGQRLLTQPRVVVFYLSLLLWPAPSRLSLLQYFDPSTSLVSPITTIASMAVLVALAAAALRLSDRYRIVSFAIAWWFLHLSIESTVIALEMAYEHRIYLPSVGFFIAGPSLLIGALAERRVLVLASVALLIALLGVATVTRNETWRDAIGFWEDVVAKSPGDYRSHVNLGNQLIDAGRFDEALTRIEAGIATSPDSPFAHFAAGVALERAGRNELAARRFDEAIERAPEFAEARRARATNLLAQGRLPEAAEEFESALRLRPEDASIVAGLAAALARQGRQREARRAIEHALRLDPRQFVALRERGAMALFAGKPEAAERDLLAALAVAPRDASSNFYLAALREAQKRNAEAIAALEISLEANPRLHDAANNLAWLLATAAEAPLRDPPKAVQLAEAATADTPRDPGRLDTLAAAYASTGRMAEAVAAAKRAATLARETGNEAMARDIEARATLYRQGRAYVAE